MAWGSKTEISNAVTVDSTTLQDRTTGVTSTPGESFHVQVEANFPASPTSNLIVHVQATLDDATENWDDVDVMSFEIDNGTDPSAVSFIISGVYRWSLIYNLDTGTDSVTVDADYRADNLDL